jgi:hypothetical protein
MTSNRSVLVLTLSALAILAAARPSRGAELAGGVAVVRAPEPTERRLHKVAFGVRAGQAQVDVSAQRWSSKGAPIDDWSQRADQIVPTFCVGGDGYFLKLDFPMLITPTVKGYGLGLYPLNFGHLFKRSGLFPFASAGVAASVLTLPGQGISGASAQARAAAGLKVLLVGGLAVSAEVGYSPFLAAGVVDKQQTHDLVQSSIDGQAVDLSPGMRPARGGLGRGVDFLIGIEWL